MPTDTETRIKYGIDSKKGFVKSMLFVIDTFKIPVTPKIKNKV